jgi:4-amino-4-deoxy-L-arabinose transferase-like glycosyltransferase
VTDLLDALLAVVVAVILNLVVASQIRLRAVPDDAQFLVRVYAYAVLVRYGLAVALNIFAADSAFAATFWGDSRTYDVGGYQLALRWSGEPISTVRASTAVSGYGWVYFVGAVYYLAGRNQLLVQLVNGLIGAITLLIVYGITRRLFDRAAARWAALFMAFFPQMIFWSAGMYKDPAVLLCIGLCMFAVLMLREQLTISMVVLFVACVLALITLRFYIAYFVVFASLATFLFTQRQRHALRLLLTYGVLAGLLYGALTVGVRRETLERQSSYMTLERLQTTRADQAILGRSSFGRGYDASTPAGALRALPVGLVYLLFAPFPWAVSGLRQALAVPETLVWYALMPSFVRGVLWTAKHRLRAALPILVFATTLTAAYALMQGNVGTAYRQRTQITMFFFVFMGAGIAKKRRQQLGRAQEAPNPAC